MNEAMKNTSIEEQLTIYHAIIESSMDGFWLLDTQGHILLVNDAYCKMSGFSEEELLSMVASDIDIAKDADEILTQIREITELGMERFKSQHRRKDGKVIDVEISIQFRYISDCKRYICYIRDVTDYLETEKELHQLDRQVKVLRELLPICAGCKKIRDKHDAWHQIEFYIRNHSNFEFSHGMCPECIKKWYPEADTKK